MVSHGESKILIQEWSLCMIDMFTRVKGKSSLQYSGSGKKKNPHLCVKDWNQLKDLSAVKRKPSQ